MFLFQSQVADPLSSSRCTKKKVYLQEQCVCTIVIRSCGSLIMSTVEVSPTLLFQLSEIAVRQSGKHNYGIVLGQDAGEDVKYAQAGFDVPVLSNLQKAGSIAFDMEYLQTRLKQMLTVWPQKSIVGMYAFTSAASIDTQVLALTKDLLVFSENLYGSTTAIAVLLVNPAQLTDNGSGVHGFVYAGGSVQTMNVALSSDETEQIATNTIDRHQKYFVEQDQNKFDGSGYSYEQLKELQDRLVDVLRAQVDKILLFVSTNGATPGQRDNIDRHIVQLSRLLNREAKACDTSVSLISSELSMLTMQLASLDKLKAISRKSVIGYKSYDAYRPPGSKALQ